MKNKSISIFGFGNFGALLAAVLSQHFTVQVYKHNSSKQLKEKAHKLGVDLVDFDTAALADIIILSVPISKTEELIKKIAQKMKPGSLLLDTCSVKVLPCSWMEKYAPKNIEILGTHPMFGPTTSKFDLDKLSWELKGLQLILCPLRISKERLDWLKDFFTKLELHIISTTPEDHDRQNAKTLSLVHYIGRILLASGIHEQEIFTPGYADLLRILPHTTSDNWQLFYDMNNYNPYAQKLRQNFRLSGLDLEEKILLNSDHDMLARERELIDMIDKNILLLLERRFASVKRIGQIKKKRNLSVYDPEREKEIIDNKKKLSELDPKFIEELFKQIFEESYKKQ